MRSLLVALLLFTTGGADAAGRTLEMKWIAQLPGLFRSRVAQEPVRTRLPALDACGDHVTTIDVVINVAADGTLAKVRAASTDRKRPLASDHAACIERVLGDITYPARRRGSEIRFALMRQRAKR